MSITIDGSGTITGISAGGLPDGVITTDDIAANAVTTPKLGSNEVSGLAKAWVNFNGTGTVAIRASYNVSSITDLDVSEYRVNLTTAMPDTSYACAGGTGTSDSTPNGGVFLIGVFPFNASTVNVNTFVYVSGSYVPVDVDQVTIEVFR